MLILSACSSKQNKLSVKVYETSAKGNKLKQINDFHAEDKNVSIQLFPDKKYQNIIGFGGAFTESSAFLLNKLSNEKRKQIIDAYFGSNGAAYSLTRTH
ncbi:MAG: glycosyl hydrolase family 30, partial [Bacteroidetes bacterium]